MVNTKLDISICGPTSVFHFDPHPLRMKMPPIVLEPAYSQQGGIRPLLQQKIPCTQIYSVISWLRLKTSKVTPSPWEIPTAKGIQKIYLGIPRDPRDTWEIPRKFPSWPLDPWTDSNWNTLGYRSCKLFRICCAPTSSGRWHPGTCTAHDQDHQDRLKAWGSSTPFETSIYVYIYMALSIFAWSEYIEYISMNTIPRIHGWIPILQLPFDATISAFTMTWTFWLAYEFRFTPE